MKNQLQGYEVEAARLWLAIGFKRKTVATGMHITKDQVRGVAEGRYRKMAAWLVQRAPWSQA
jgi:hypothetical protein